MNIAIFGGSFDPVHIAHEAIVKKAINLLEIDKLIVVPTYLNPFKSKYYFEPKTRKFFLENVFKDLKKVEICDFEIKQEKAVYSIDTVKYLKNLYNPSKIYLIIGEDNLKSLDKWYKIDELKSLVEIVVATRSGYDEKNIKEFKTLNLDINISSTYLRESLNLDYIPTKIKTEILKFQKEKGFNS